ncbi:MAG: class I SAM-dependent methyltransferase [Flavobacteriales bacterium]|nr:class I SAM-dependent methyltransferase [Flavobacteriia bacterium]NCP05916.1 class I SAM-dependent methyltransferase [Flavobacteriales bacterium]PIV93872.1 MAG: methyltransferase [Flavobacteriaceae bacterium CG17_big_fil_post_rev_8_21_14_2_50_33_15]PIY09392.1 MAG: methyltransferase [Flavobacteriaceae bacterium CG_4_10_14_3_um_filter_33_47]PJB17671.1 MAG: methyltransferase [Flavobacteriaceae bacterium CG_4_9_14_3_um_filter_33_16]
MFELIYNKKLDFLETKPQPTLDKLSDYYKSEDYISHTDSKRNLFETTYQFIKKIALKKKLKLINTYSKSGKVLLDMGCGTGSFLQIAQQNGWKVLGIEPNQDARKIANNKIGDFVFDVDHLIKLEKERYDVITLWHVLEHLPNIEVHIKIFKRLLKQNGTLIIAVPNYKSYDAQFYKNHWAAFDVPRHLWHFSKTAISKLVALENMKVIKTYPMLFDAFYVSLLSEKYKTGNMNPVRAFWIGLFSNLKGIQTKEYSSIIYCIKKA